MEYCCPGFSQKQIEKAFKAMVFNSYKVYVNRMHTKWKQTGRAAPHYPREVWAKWEAHWRGENFKKNSEIAKNNRNSNEGQGSVHTGGSISFSESWDRLVKRHGPDVDAAEAFLATHSSVLPNGTRKWSSPQDQEIYETYVRRAREEAVEEGIIEPESTSLPPFRGGLWKAITLQDKRQRGDRIYGFGNHGAGFFDDLPLCSQSTQALSSSSIPSVDYDAQLKQKDEIIANLTETLNTQVDTRVNTQVEKMRQEMEQQMHQKMEQQMQEMMRSMFQQQMLQHQQQPSSGNNSNSSIGPYLNSHGTFSGTGRRGGRGGSSTQSRKTGGT